jgi:hypothetical protein
MADSSKLRARLETVVRDFLAEEGLSATPGQGQESLFAALEETAVEIGDAVGREVLREQLAAQPEAACRCPTCGDEGQRKRERQRLIETRRGRVDVTEIEGYCRRCRRSFFPSVQGVGPGTGL